MIRLLGSITITLLTVTALPFCKKDPFNCKDELVGETYLSDESKQFFPAINAQVLKFENANGQTRDYAVEKTEFRTKLNVEKLCESFNLSTHYRYMHGDRIIYKLRGPEDSTEISLMTVSYALKNRKDTCFYDHLSVTRFEQLSGVELLKIVSFRGRAESQIPQSDLDAQFARFVGDTTFHGVPYQKVYAGRLVSGSAPSSPQNLYVAQGKGLVAFRDDSGMLWRRKD